MRSPAAITTPAAAPPLASRLAVSLLEAEQLTGLSVSSLKRAAASGELRLARCGARVVARIVDIDDFLRRRADSELRAVEPLSVDVAAEQPATARSGAMK